MTCMVAAEDSSLELLERIRIACLDHDGGKPREPGGVERRKSKRSHVSTVIEVAAGVS